MQMCVKLGLKQQLSALSCCENSIAYIGHLDHCVSLSVRGFLRETQQGVFCLVLVSFLPGVQKVTVVLDIVLSTCG